MFKKEETQQFNLPKTLWPIAIDPYVSATDMIGRLVTLLRRDIDNMKYNVAIESDSKIIEVTVSVKTRKSTNND